MKYTNKFGIKMGHRRASDDELAGYYEESHEINHSQNKNKSIKKKCC